MRYTIQAKILKGEKKEVIQNFTSNYITDEVLTALQIKEMAKARVLAIPDSEITGEVLYLGNKLKSEPSELIKPISGLEYNLIIK